MKTIRIGSGAGYGGDRIEPAVDLMERGSLDYIIFECLAERTIALAQLRKSKDPDKGYNDLFEYRMQRILPVLARKKVKVITNMGAANPLSAMRKAAEMAEALGLHGLKIAAVTGDDVFDRLDRYADCTVIETGQPLRALQGEKLSANACPVFVKEPSMSLLSFPPIPPTESRSVSLRPRYMQQQEA